MIKGSFSDISVSGETFAYLGCMRLAAHWTDSYPVAQFWFIWSVKLGLPEYPPIYITLGSTEMPELTTAAVSGSLRVGLHVVSNYRRPVLEIYHQVCNRFGPEQEIDLSSRLGGDDGSKLKTRFQDIFVQFTLVNIGGVRAEDVELKIVGNLTRHEPRNDFGGAFRSVIPQFAPGQSHFLFKFEEYDFYRYLEGGGARQLKADTFTITATYNGPRGIQEWFLGLPARLRGRKRFKSEYTFSPAYVEGDLPPAEYAA